MLNTKKRKAFLLINEVKKAAHQDEAETTHKKGFALFYSKGQSFLKLHRKNLITIYKKNNPKPTSKIK
jgi:arginine utilization protein RocB